MSIQIPIKNRPMKKNFQDLLWEKDLRDEGVITEGLNIAPGARKLLKKVNNRPEDVILAGIEAGEFETFGDLMKFLEKKEREVRKQVEREGRNIKESYDIDEGIFKDMMRGIYDFGMGTISWIAKQIVNGILKVVSWVTKHPLGKAGIIITVLGTGSLKYITGLLGMFVGPAVPVFIYGGLVVWLFAEMREAMARIYGRIGVGDSTPLNEFFDENYKTDLKWSDIIRP